MIPSEKLLRFGILKSALLVLFVVPTLLLALPGQAKAFSADLGGSPVDISVSGSNSYAPRQTIPVNFVGYNSGSWRYVYIYLNVGGVSFNVNQYFNGSSPGPTYGTWYLTAPSTPGTYYIGIEPINSYSQVVYTYFPITVACASGTVWNGSSCVCPAGTTSWTVGATCSGSYANITDGVTSVVSSTNGNIGSVSLSCSSGNVSQSNASCSTAVSCTATAYGSCSLSTTASGGTSGSCSTGYTIGSCSYSCSNGTWTKTSNTCALPAASGSVTSNSCAISSGASSCAMNVAWASSNTTGTVTIQRPYDNNSIFATGTSGNQSATFTPPATYNLDLYDGTTKLATGSFVASCAQGSTWDGSICMPDPCTAQTVNHCDLPATASDTSSSGSCSSGYGGSCSYTCSSGTWIAPSSNSCTPFPTVTLSASPPTIDQGQSSTLSWNSTNATSCTSYGGFSTNSSTVGNASVNPSATANYQIYCTGPGGTTSTNSNIVPITVLVPTVSIGASPARVTSGDPTTVTVMVTNVSSCAITKNGNPSPWQTFSGNPFGTVTQSFSDTNITTQNTYQVTCSNTGSSVTAAAKQIVNITTKFNEF